MIGEDCSGCTVAIVNARAWQVSSSCQCAPVKGNDRQGLAPSATFRGRLPWLRLLRRSGQVCTILRGSRRKTAIKRAQSGEKRQVLITSKPIVEISKIFILSELHERRDWKTGSQRGEGGGGTGVVRTGRMPDRLDRRLRAPLIYLPVCASGG
jgi:hypothetical protein